MPNIGTLFIVNFGFCFALLGTVVQLSYLLFKSLKKSHADYYTSIGEPIVMMPTVRLSDTEEGYVQNGIRSRRGAFFTYHMVFRGLSKDFPKDVKLRKLALAIRIILTIFLISLVPLIILGSLFYRSGL
jgi:hypothetical protein